MKTTIQALLLTTIITFSLTSFELKASEPPRKEKELITIQAIYGYIQHSLINNSLIIDNQSHKSALLQDISSILKQLPIFNIDTDQLLSYQNESEKYALLHLAALYNSPEVFILLLSSLTENQREKILALQSAYGLRAFDLALMHPQQEILSSIAYYNPQLFFQKDGSFRASLKLSIEKMGLLQILVQCNAQKELREIVEYIIHNPLLHWVIQHPNEQGKTALDIARDLNNQTIINFLKDIQIKYTHTMPSAQLPIAQSPIAQLPKNTKSPSTTSYVTLRTPGEQAETYSNYYKKLLETEINKDTPKLSSIVDLINLGGALELTQTAYKDLLKLVARKFSPQSTTKIKNALDFPLTTIIDNDSGDASNKYLFNEIQSAKKRLGISLDTSPINKTTKNTKRPTKRKLQQNSTTKDTKNIITNSYFLLSRYIKSKNIQGVQKLVESLKSDSERIYAVLNYQDSYLLQTLFHETVLASNTAIFTILLNCLDSTNHKNAYTSLFLPDSQGYTIVDYIIEKQQENILTIKDKQERTLLHYAVQTSKYSVAHQLVDYILKHSHLQWIITYQDTYGKSPLEYAQEQQNRELIMLFENDHFQLTPVLEPVLENEAEQEEIINTFLNNEAFDETYISTTNTTNSARLIDPERTVLSLPKIPFFEF